MSGTEMVSLEPVWCLDSNGVSEPSNGVSEPIMVFEPSIGVLEPSNGSLEPSNGAAKGYQTAERLNQGFSYPAPTLICAQES